MTSAPSRMLSFGVSSNHTNNTTFTDLAPLIIFILTGAAIAIVVVAAALGISALIRRRRGGNQGRETRGLPS